ncbi:MAG TPA: nucleoside recognition domain-containing protein [Bacteroidota bacterium]|nr:nucleoside recognition domain-containing protein [Bacteroidota bacterium]
MLNYIWLALLVIGIGVALYGDVSDISANKYHNGEEISCIIQFSQHVSSPPTQLQKMQCAVAIATQLPAGSGTLPDTIIQKAELFPGGTLHIFIDEQTPAILREVFEAQKNEFLLVHAKWESFNGREIPAVITFDPVRFVRINAVTNDGIIKYAKTAVELAIGLIGLMALWLGIMKIAEQAGLVAMLAAVLRPVTTRLFPDVPADHPAMGAMIMNISANMLGLNNAATPLGLKAMEELNRLNKKAGTATDAMVTFLVINTSNLQIIPASVIAIRAAAGSSNPAEIIGTVIVASALTMVIAIITVKLMAKLPGYRKQLLPTEES